MRIFFALLTAIVSLAGCTIGTANVRKSKPEQHYFAPGKRVERLTSYILRREIENARGMAIYIKHKEEGKKLLQAATEAPAPEK